MPNKQTINTTGCGLFRFISVLKQLGGQLHSCVETPAEHLHSAAIIFGQIAIRLNHFSDNFSAETTVDTQVSTPRQTMDRYSANPLASVACKSTFSRHAERVRRHLISKLGNLEAP